MSTKLEQGNAENERHVHKKTNVALTMKDHEMT